MGNVSMLLNRRAMDPRWPWHHRSVAIGHMRAVCEIFRRPQDGNDYGWDPYTGGVTHVNREGDVTRPDIVLFYRGQVRVAPNQDWRAQTRTVQGDSGNAHDVRFQVPIKDCPPVHTNDVIRVLESPADMELVHFVFHVRNVTMGSSPWVRNLMCSTDVAHPQILPPPYQEPVVDRSAIPHPTTDCGCG